MDDVPPEADEEAEGQEDEEPEPVEVKLSVSEQKIVEERSNMLVAHFLFSLVWSVGGVLDGPSRLKFDDFFRTLCDSDGSKAKHPRYQQF